MMFDSKTSSEVMRHLKGIKPPNSAIMINGSHTMDVQVTCDGRIPDMGYHCYLDPGHEGDCWTQIKRVHFTPTHGRNEWR